MAELHHSLGTNGLLLRTERGVQQLALANNGPLLDGAYETTAALEIAEDGRIMAEVALAVPGRICMAVDDGGTLLPRDAGTPNPQYTLYRLVPVPVDGEEPQIRYENAERLSAEIDPLDVAAWWTLTCPQVAAQAEDSLDSSTGWRLTAPLLAGKLDDGLDTRASWTLEPDSLPATQEPPPPATVGGDTTTTTYTEPTTADWSAAVTSGWKSHLRWWANSNGPFVPEVSPAIHAWQTLYPGVRWNKLDGSLMVAPAYYRPSGQGEINTRGTADPNDSVLVAQAQIGWDPTKAWTLFILATAHSPLPTAQTCLWAATSLAEPAPVGIEVHAGSASQGIRVVCRGSSRTFDTALATGGFHLIEVHVAAGAAVGSWGLALDGTEQTQSAVVAGDVVPAWQYGPERLFLFGGQGAPHFRGAVRENILIQTDDSAVRAAVRAYLAAKFNLTFA